MFLNLSFEFDFIYNYFAKLSKNNFSNDGCEIIVPNGKKLVVSKDILISGVHFFKDDAPESIAQKSLRKNLSDLAAMGAQPYGYMLGISLPKNTTKDFIIDFCAGLKIVQDTYNFNLLGGDTNSNNDNLLIISITIFGFADMNNNLMPRNNAKVGDKIYISDELGNGYLGYLVRTKNQLIAQLNNKEFFLNHFLYGNCRVDLGLKIVNKANSCIDISDGLFQDLMHICKNSSVSAKLNSSRIPINPEAKKLIQSGILNYHDLLKWGDDYELLICGEGEKLKDINGIFEIGEIVEGNSKIYLDNKVMKDWKGFEH